jgi:hypothetical protein
MFSERTPDLVLCHAQDLGLAGKTGSGTENRNGPKGALHFRYLTPFSSDDSTPLVACDKALVALCRVHVYSGESSPSSIAGGMRSVFALSR